MKTFRTEKIMGGRIQKAERNRRKKLAADIVEWDVINWWRAVRFWEETRLFENVRGKKVLDVGGRNGGLSLYWALKGADVTCSDIYADGFEKAKELHKKYGVEGKIKYEIIDATKIPYRDNFDIICLKSVLGGVGGGNKPEKVMRAAQSIHAALKEGGILCLCENLTASPLHQFARKRYTRWGKRWMYLHLSEIPDLFSSFSIISSQTFGFLGVFGRRKWLAGILGSMDCCLDRFVKKEHRYIVSCVLRK